MVKINGIIHILLLAMLLSCADMGQDFAGTSEQGNARVCANVYDSEGSPAVGATVRFRRADYVKELVLYKRLTKSNETLLTDSTGTFTIDSPDTGTFVIEVTDGSKEAVKLACRVSSQDTGLITLEPAKLQPFATIRGKVAYDPMHERRFVQVPGLERLVEVDVDGFYSIPDMPAGTYSVRIISTQPSVTPRVINQVEAVSGQTTTIPFTGWLYSKPVYLNTAASGADVSGHVYNFPVLIRLHEDNFRFREAQSDGEDIRFVKADADSTAVPFEIERWDSQAGRAEIWVKADTIYGNSTTRYFVMLWGNADAQAINQTGKVFDTTDGFHGVWHLSDNEAGLVEDATPGMLNGTSVNVQYTEGVIGGAGLFGGDDSYITIPNSAAGALNYPYNGTYTISAWVNTDSIHSNRIIASKGDVQYYLKIHNRNWHFAEHDNDAVPGWHHTDYPYAFDNWVHLHGVQNGTSQYLYVNGVCVDSTTTRMGGEELRDESFDFEIGRRLLPDGSDGQYFRGRIDEVRASGVARDDTWIKLSYMNQKEADRLVVIGK